MSSPREGYTPHNFSPILRPALKRDSSKLTSPSVDVNSPDYLNVSTSQPLSPSPSDDSKLPASDTSPPHTTGVGMLHPMSSSSFNPPGYTNKVSFDTFENNTPGDATMFSYTLQAASEGYHKSRNTRVFLCAASADSSGMQALDWAMDSLVQDGDELIVVRGFDPEDLQKQSHEDLRDEAKELMRLVLEKNTAYEGRSLSVIVEFIAGKITETIERLIALYRPDSLVVGTRGPRSTLKVWGAALGAPGMGSVSRYCVSRSPYQPERKTRKFMEKRRADPKRNGEFPE
ncbi:uncharacterized protein EI90DRAFT_3144170 [Cantharellus anzutake]|uniref:uncharacterized protein n=1 Tax=Cantharellus anzutake TaxID=1750568 RepID=UPI001904B3E0|nr:uncharacterized protein EI90DRAFT_3144170 [Cantharellus anzutake]KAF8338762.1 hypothetical protein EI90DRAFT_3144170 [Cantharellus anzutake]